MSTEKYADSIYFYGVIEAFRQGLIPNNKQIEETLRYMKDIDQLSPDGR
jgi:hypothetical protein